MKHILILSLMFCVTLAFGQTNSSHEKQSASLFFSLDGTLIFPGFQVGMEIPFKEVHKLKFNNHSILKQRFVKVGMGYYHHKNYHDNSYVLIGLGFRRRGSKGFFRYISPSIGYSRTFLGGTTYQVNDSGEVSRKKNAGFNYLRTSLSMGIGYDFFPIKEKPVSLFGEFSLTGMYPYNNVLYMRPMISLGAILKPFNLISWKTKIIKK